MTTAPPPARPLPRAALFLLTSLLLGLLPTSDANATTQSDDAGGVGAFPANIIVPDALRGTTIERDFGLINDGDQPRSFELQAAGPAAPWATFVRKDTGEATDLAVVPAGANLKMRVRLEIPADARNGRYEGVVRAIAQSVTSDEGSVQSVRMGIELGLVVTVSGDQVIAGEFLDLVVGSTEVGLPARIDARLRNDGNVVAIPDLHYVVRHRDDVVDEFDGGREVLPIGEFETVGHGWDTTEQRPGPYTVEVHAQWDGLDLGVKSASFELFPRGTLTRDVEAHGLALVNQPDTGEIAQLRAEFKNVGEIEARVQFVGRLEFDGSLVGVVETPLKLVLPGDAETLDIWLDVPDRGTYRLVGVLNYEGQETPELELEFAVPVTPATRPVVLAGAAATLLLLTIGLVGWVARRRRRRSPPIPDEDAVRERQLIGAGERR